MISRGYLFLSSILKNPDPIRYYKMALSETLFQGDEVNLFRYIDNHVQKYGQLPHVETVKSEFPGIQLPNTLEPPEYYLDKMERRHVYTLVRNATLEADALLKDQKEGEAFSTVYDALGEAIVVRDRKKVINLSEEAANIILADYRHKTTLGLDYGIKLGWGTFDEMVGGLDGGDVLVIAGRPATGKSFLTLYNAHHAWEAQGKCPLYVSMEMKPLQITQRFAALHASVPITPLKKAELEGDQHKSMLQELRDLAEASVPFWVVDGALAASVKDIVAITRQVKPDVVFVDGAYLLRHTNPKASNWERIKGVVEDIKQHVAEALDLPVVLSYQLNRGSEKKKGQFHGVADLAYSDAIGQIASVVLGLMEEEDLSNLHEKKVTVLKGRSGERGEFLINWRFDKIGPNGFMDFSEVNAVDCGNDRLICL